MHHSSASCGCRTPECLDGFRNSSNPLAEVGVCSVSLCTQYTTFAVITKESGCLGDVNVSIKVVIITSQIFTFNKLIDALFDGFHFWYKMLFDRLNRCSNQLLMTQFFASFHDPYDGSLQCILSIFFNFSLGALVFFDLGK